MSKLNDFMLQFGVDKFLHFVGGACLMTITNSWIMIITVSIGKELSIIPPVLSLAKSVWTPV